MNDLFYEMIFKRKSFHLFRGVEEKISQIELDKIEKVFKELKPLVSEIKVNMKIVPANATTCKRGEEYCILLYSEKKDNYLQNIGYIGEQLDLYLTSMNIGSLWFGIGKVEEEKYNDLEFVIMIAISKMSEDKFRKYMFKSKRKLLEEIWHGEQYQNIGNIARFAPSACNSQPWIVEITDNKLKVYRYKKKGKRGIMPIDKVNYYNKIDIGIFLLFLEVCLRKENISFEREIMIDNGKEETEKTLNAIYNLKQEIV